MKLRELIERTSMKAASRNAGHDPRYSTDFILPSMRMVEACRTDELDFFKPFLDNGMLSTAQVHRAAGRYHLGKTLKGKPVFWMIDEMYEPQDAHIGTDEWISTLLKAREPLIRCWRPTHCLFGQHLLCRTDSAESRGTEQRPISIVESEASAVVLSELFPESTWMAYVNKMFLDADSFAPMEGCRVTIFPRTDPSMSDYLFFEDFAAAIRKELGIHIAVASFLEERAGDEQKAREIDLLDFILEGS